ncbi:hypothetical protein I79_010205 [Cricetulus griseus]|uniref:Uncharacterized protein n=1 Tax=Cricetulus griseus TaxID=10029 RepID=G3HHU5_CRIGR|nr:hypothetical protein I79_010205 [Cricetulus griseus]
MDLVMHSSSKMTRHWKTGVSEYPAIHRRSKNKLASHQFRRVDHPTLPSENNPYMKTVTYRRCQKQQHRKLPFSWLAMATPVTVPVWSSYSCSSCPSSSAHPC